eukprot:TRINITY_DN8621_c0_g1_i2.p2 TRINITY_DN8621_c0_g1~~TRINITY_DN8621_c0_g1_i2.p2  ORF type:complete len:142 (-),score=51.77 TRINITY_DN8621_c0_g1_i2:525-950(-)
MVFFFFFFKQKTAYEMLRSLVGSEMCIRDRYQRRVREFSNDNMPSASKRRSDRSVESILNADLNRIDQDEKSGKNRRPGRDRGSGRTQHLENNKTQSSKGRRREQEAEAAALKKAITAYGTTIREVFDHIDVNNGAPRFVG